jgi:hypothetical protein
MKCVYSSITLQPGHGNLIGLRSQLLDSRGLRMCSLLQFRFRLLNAWTLQPSKTSPFIS